MAKTYEIFKKDQKIMPQSNVSEIYHGANLIWMRSKHEPFVFEIIGDVGDSEFFITKNGLVCPLYVMRGERSVLYDLNLGQTDFTDAVAGLNAYDARAIYGDCVMYADVKAGDSSKDERYLCSTDGQNFSLMSMFAENFTDYTTQWFKALGGPLWYYLDTIRTQPVIWHGFQGGLYPVARPFSIQSGQSEQTRLRFVDSSGLATGDGYIVMNVTDYGCLCAENLSPEAVSYDYGPGDGVFKSDLTLRKNGVLEKKLLSGVPTVSMNAKKNYIYNMCGDCLYVTRKSSGNCYTDAYSLIDGSKIALSEQPVSRTLSYNIGFLNGLYFAVGSTYEPANDFYYSDDGVVWNEWTLPGGCTIYTPQDASYVTAGAFCIRDEWIYMIVIQDGIRKLARIRKNA